MWDDAWPWVAGSDGSLSGERLAPSCLSFFLEVCEGIVCSSTLPLISSPQKKRAIRPIIAAAARPLPARLRRPPSFLAGGGEACCGRRTLEQPQHQPGSEGSKV